ncbi:ATP-dependent helicase/nuclease subunit B [Rhodobacter sp. JA431]|uniref:PD-(D/E)XK nuclease family protein n=1 Tax=Rhodobacter sp. JA431 TaxID=570013 RepID=UPI000BC5E910|nr:PD-(D/E)XK nuclease family protein [Rhodobacter sp. JA431]SOC08029.1 ATP-dependent helicase/nuclease subunit B [Rhodobacter sp. JA431]
MPVELPKVFALPCGVDFARELVRGLVDRLGDAPPEEMAQTLLFLNSGRMQRRVREEFDRLGTRFLPRLHLVTDLSRFPVPGLPPAAPPLRRKLELARLVDQLARGLPAFETGSGIFTLTDSLAALMDEMHSEGVAPEALERLDIRDSHAEHWRQSLQFIRIVSQFFAADSDPHPEMRQRRVIEHLAHSWAEMPNPPRVIVAGSTGSRGATRLLMQAVATLPEGALVLPGYDFDMPKMAWNSLYSGPFPIEDHPQFRFRALLDALSMSTDQVQPWTTATPPAPARNALVSLALRPSPVTDQWMQEGQGLSDLPKACQDITLIEAADPRQEALSLALVLRDAVERGQSAALITPDRMLTRRVTAALDRWGIVPDDSAGLPLALSAPGRLIRHLARLPCAPLTLDALLVVLKHPLVATGGAGRGDHLRFTRDLELKLRRDGPAFPTPQAIQNWAGAVGGDCALWGEWLAGVLAQIAPPTKQPVSAWLETHLALLSGFAAGPAGTVEASELWQAEAGRAAWRVVAELRGAAEEALEVSAGNYADLIDSLLDKGQVRNPLAAHPKVIFLGTLEARVHGADLAILAGLNEKSWPEAPAPDPWLSRQMRLEAGLLVPERQIGLSAHDFQQAIGAPKVVLSRARRDAEAETVPSRWLNRLLNLMEGLPHAQGPEALKAMRARGGKWMAMAQVLEAPTATVPPAPRPAPRPPEDARPRQLSVTAVKTLIRDPYAIYARNVLRLNPLDPLTPEPDPRLRGEALHLVVERFVDAFDPQMTAEDAQALLMQIAEDALTEMISWPSAQRLWLARISRIAPNLVAQEFGRRAEGSPALIETKGGVDLSKLNFRLTAKPDRIDVLQDGSAVVYDYKSGTVPSDAQVALFDKQLPLEAAMITRGAFSELGPRPVAAMRYIRLGGTGECRTLKLAPEDVEETWAKLEALLARYLRRDQGFVPRRALETTRERSDYDQISRFGEWDITDLSVPEDVG